MSAQKITETANSKPSRRVGGFRVFWLFLIMNSVLGTLVIGFFLLSWLEFSQGVMKGNIKYYSLIFSKFIAKDLRDNRFESKWISQNVIEALSKMPEDQRYSLVMAETLRKYAEESDVLKVGFAYPGGWFAEVVRKNNQLYFHCSSPQRTDNLYYRYDKKEKHWEKCDLRPDFETLLRLQQWYKLALVRPGKIVQSAPKFNTDTYTMDMYYARSMYEQPVKENPVVYCHIRYDFKNITFADYSLDKNRDKAIFEDIPETTEEKAALHRRYLPIYIMTEQHRIFGRDPIDFGRYQDKPVTLDNPASYADSEYLRELASKIKSGELILPTTDADMVQCPIPTAKEPNAQAVAVWLDSYKWWIVIVIPGQVIDLYVYNGIYKIGLILAVFLVVFLFFYLVSERYLSRPLSTLSERIANMQQLIFSGKRTHNIIREVNRIEDSLSVFENFFRSSIKFLPREVILQQIRSGKETEPEINTRSMSLFSCRLQNFTDILSETQEFLQQYKEFISILQNEVACNGGTLISINNFNIIASWDSGDKMQQAAENACKAAINCIKRLDHANTKWDASGLSMMQCTFAVFTGSLFVGNFGTENWLEFSVTGKGMAIVDRIHHLLCSKGIKAGVSKSTRDLLGEMFLLRPAEYSEDSTQGDLCYELCDMRGNDKYFEEKERFYADYCTAWELLLSGKYDKSIALLSELHNSDPDDKLVADILALAAQIKDKNNSGPNQLALEIARRLSQGQQD